MKRLLKKKGVAIRYKISAATGNESFADDIFEVVDFDTKVFATHEGTVKTGAGWVFTAPESGYYHVLAQIRWANGTNLSDCTLTIRKNSSDYSLQRIDTGSSVFTQATGALVYLAQGSTIDVRAAQNDTAAAARNISTNGEQCFIEIFKVA